MQLRNGTPGRLAGLAMLLLVAACGQDHSRDLRELAPLLSAEMASHLANDNSRDFARFTRRVRRAELEWSASVLFRAPPTHSLEDFLRVEGFVEPYIRRLIDVLSKSLRLNTHKAVYEGYQRWSPADRLEIVKLLKEQTAFPSSATNETPEETLKQLIERTEPYADIFNNGHLYGVYASLLPFESHDEILHCLHLGVEEALSFPPDSAMACQLLGMLGLTYGKLGDTETMRNAWDRGLACARAMGSWQEARILTFYGRHYYAQGQFAIYRDLLLEAQDCSRTSDLPEMEIRFINDTLRFFVGLDCWDIVGRSLQRADMAYNAGRSHLSQGDLDLERMRLQGTRARYLSKVGQCTEAMDLALATADYVDGWALGQVRSATIQLDAARTLATCDLSRAQHLLEEGLRLCRETPIPELVHDYASELADLYASMGQLDASQRILETDDPPPATVESVQHGIVALRLAIARGDRAEMFAKLRDALQRLGALGSQLDASPESYIAVVKNDALRRLAHKLLDDSPEAGYSFEMGWRRPVSLARSLAEIPGSESAVVSTLESQARQSQGPLGVHQAIHCVYDVRDDVVVRFTADGNGISKTRLDCSPRTLRARVQKVRNELGKASLDSGGLAPELAADLRQLAIWLLPESVLHPRGPRLFLTTANDCLTRLRFETLNVDPHGYLPLLGRVDVASIRRWGKLEVGSGDSAIVVSNPTYSANLKRRYPILTEPLPASAIEAGHVQTLLPRSATLAGPAASKRNLVERWERARILYLAGHSVQDTELPYVMFIPLSGSPEGHEDDWYLEVSDVRKADLSRCRLVVLSSCSSGAPFLDGRVEAPSLADVFVDVGAWAAVSTGWTVRDDDAARIMDAFMRSYAAEGESDPIMALCRARREVAADTPDPRIWGTYSITIGGLPLRRLLTAAGQDTLTPPLR